MSHAVLIPDELYRMIEEYAARRGESAEAAILAWAESLREQQSEATAETAPTEAASDRINDPEHDPWAGFRGIAEVRSADSIDRHDAYLAEEYTATHAPDR
jgi:hypothetical protein